MFKVPSIQYIYSRLHIDPVSEYFTFNYLPLEFHPSLWLGLLFGNLQFCFFECSLTHSSRSSAALCSPSVCLSDSLESWTPVSNHLPQLEVFWTCPVACTGLPEAWRLNPEMHWGSWGSAPLPALAPFRKCGAAWSWCLAPLGAPCPWWPHTGSGPSPGWRRRGFSGSGGRSEGMAGSLSPRGG